MPLTPSKTHKYINPSNAVTFVPRKGHPGFIELRPWNEPHHKPGATYVVEGEYYAQFTETGQLAPFREAEPVAPLVEAPAPPVGDNQGAATSEVAGSDPAAQDDTGPAVPAPAVAAETTQAPREEAKPVDEVPRPVKRGPVKRT